MKRILIPAMGKSLFFADSYFPKLMIEINGKTMLEHIIDDYKSIGDKHYIFVFSEEECRRFHLDDSARILTDDNADILVLKNETQGALCTCLMAVQYIKDADPLIIANCDQVISEEYAKVIGYFETNNDDAGVIVFDSIHPRWSYTRIDDDEVVETAEKRPLSKNAIAGFYYFRKGNDFVEAAKQVIRKDNRLDGNFYISSAMNEMILLEKKVGYYRISKDSYHSFYSPDKVREFEARARGESV